MKHVASGDHPPILPFCGTTLAFNYKEEGSDVNDQGQPPGPDVEHASAPGPRTDTLIWLATRRRTF